MSKRKVKFSDESETKFIDPIHEDDYDGEDSNNGDESKGETKKEHSFGKKFKHTLDSDEEDDEICEEKYNVLDDDAIDGQEDDSAVDCDGEIRITPFNMKEELEEGHFDREGTYIWNKDDDVRDNWLDNIDWVGIKGGLDTGRANTSHDRDDEKSPIDLQISYNDMIALMESGESVQRAIQRLGKECGNVKGPHRSNRWKSKGAKQSDSHDPNLAKNKESLLKLTTIANDILLSGDTDIYQKTYEQLQFHLKMKQNSGVTESGGDMFADDFEANKIDNPKSDSNNDAPNMVQWEFKWENTDDAKIYGPHTNQEMLNWVNEGYFESGVFVRQIGKSDGSFYNSRRIDFELYI